MGVKRRVMKFLVPLTIESLGRSDLTGRAIVPLYLNPQSFSLQDTKIIKETLTKGGYVVQYWGEQLGEIQVAGTTGSGGIEAVNILNDVYRNEIDQFNKLLQERAIQLSETARSTLDNSSAATAGAGVTAILDDITQGGFSGIVNGAESAIEAITDAARGITEDNPNAVELIPTVAGFATNMILSWQGVKYTGYFKNFKVDENAANPGHFNYQFTFMVTKRRGRRKNFMPWHRKAQDAGGNPITVSVPRRGPSVDELTFRNRRQLIMLRNQENRSNPSKEDSITSIAQETQESLNDDINRVSINRNQSIKGR